MPRRRASTRRQRPPHRRTARRPTPPRREPVLHGGAASSSRRFDDGRCVVASRYRIVSRCRIDGWRRERGFGGRSRGQRGGSGRADGIECRGVIGLLDVAASTIGSGSTTGAAARRRARPRPRPRPRPRYPGSGGLGLGLGLDDDALVDGRRRLGCGRHCGLRTGLASRRSFSGDLIDLRRGRRGSGCSGDDGRLAGGCGDRLVGGALRGSLCSGRLGRERRGGALLHLALMPTRPSSPDCAQPACSPCSSSSRRAWCGRPSPPHRGSQRHLPTPNGRRECASKPAWARQQRASQTPRRPYVQPSRSSLRRPSPLRSSRPRPTWPCSCGSSSSAQASRAWTSSASRRRSMPP